MPGEIPSIEDMRYYKIVPKIGFMAVDVNQAWQEFEKKIRPASSKLSTRTILENYFMLQEVKKEEL